MTFMNALRLSAALPVKVGAVTLPVAVVSCVCVPRALPVKFGAATDPVAVKVCACPANADPVKVGAATVPVAVKVWLWVPSADPVKLGVEAASVPTAWRWEDPAPLVTPLPVNVCALVVLDDPLNVGTPAGQLIVGCVNDPAAIVGTPAGQEIVPAGVNVMLGPAVVPVATPPVLLAVLTQVVVGPPLVDASTAAPNPAPVAPVIALLLCSRWT